MGSFTSQKLQELVCLRLINLEMLCTRRRRTAALDSHKSHQPNLSSSEIHTLLFFFPYVRPKVEDVDHSGRWSSTATIIEAFLLLQITLIPPEDLEAVVGGQHVLAAWRLQIFSVKLCVVMLWAGRFYISSHFSESMVCFGLLLFLFSFCIAAVVNIKKKALCYCHITAIKCVHCVCVFSFQQCTYCMQRWRLSKP